jgi:hypothetical protein
LTGATPGLIQTIGRIMIGVTDASDDSHIAARAHQQGPERGPKKSRAKSKRQIVPLKGIGPVQR